MSRTPVIFVLLFIGLCLLFALEIMLGQVEIPASDILPILFSGEGDKESWITIVRQSRLPRAITGILAGGGLAMAGLFMQNYFRNPLAGPSVLGLSSGASLGVALVVLFGGSLAGGLFTTPLAAGIGASAVLIIILLVARKMSVATLLIFGLMIGYITSSFIIFLERGATAEALQTFVFWGMGSFGDTTGSSLLILSCVVLAGFICALLILKYLNAMMLGREYAQSMGVPVNWVAIAMLGIAGVVTGVITAFCGPIAFLGLAVPHLARGIFSSSNHRILFPAVVLIGATLGMACDLLSRGVILNFVVPLNAVASLVGVPIVLWVILRNRRLGAWV